MQQIKYKKERKSSDSYPQARDVVSSELRSKAVLLGSGFLTILLVLWSLANPMFPAMSSWDTLLLVLFGVIGIMSWPLEKRYGASSQSTYLLWIDYGCALALIAAIFANPLCGLAILAMSEIVSSFVVKNQRKQAALLNTTSEFFGIVLAATAFHLMIPSNESTLLTLTVGAGIAAAIHYLANDSLNLKLFVLYDGSARRASFFKWLRKEPKALTVLFTAYIATTMIVTAMYLSIGAIASSIFAVLLIAVLFFARLWEAERRGNQLQENQTTETNSKQDQQHQSVPQTEPISWGLASMAFKILHTNQGRFVRHSVATARLCEHVALELRSQGCDVDPGEAWVVGLLHDVALMDKPTQVLRFAERVERLVDLEEYRERKSGGMVHLNVVDHGLPDVTLEDTDALDTHPEVGAQLLEGWPRVSEAVALHHTVCFEYDQLPLLTQILVVCDKYEMLASRDGYYTQVSLDEAVNAVFEECMGVKETPQVINALKMVLATRDGAFWDASDIDYDREVQMIASRLQAYAATQHSKQQANPVMADSQVMVGVQHEQPPLFHPLASRIHAKHTPHKENPPQ